MLSSLRELLSNRQEHYDEEFDAVILHEDNKIFALQENGLPKPLSPSHVYYSIAGIFETYCHSYKLECIITIPDDPTNEEYARVYREVAMNQLHILYKPGKDNDDGVSVDKTTPSLKSIINAADFYLSKLYLPGVRENAIKHFVICASNRYYGVYVNHFIYGKSTSNVLITEDSVNWYYNLSYVESLFNHTIHKPITKPYQNIRRDNTSCGNYVIAAASRNIENISAPDYPFAIDYPILEAHQNYYKLGINSKLQHHTNDNSINCAWINDNVAEDESGNFLIVGESPLKTCRNNVENRILTNEPNKDTNTSLLDAIELFSSSSESIDDFEISTLLDDDKHLLVEKDSALLEPHDKSDGILAMLNNINDYVNEKNNKRKHIVFALFIDNDSEMLKYSRRQSWNNVLTTWYDRLSKNSGMDEIKLFVLNEANKFYKISKKYYQLLISLHNQISGEMQPQEHEKLNTFLIECLKLDTKGVVSKYLHTYVI